MDPRSRILEAGVRLLHTNGVGALTQPRIARAAGLRQSHLTYYFPTRAELLLALAEHSVDQVLATAATRRGDPVGALLEGMRYLPRVRMLVGLVTAADRDEALRPALNRLVEHVRQALGGLLRSLGYEGTPEQVLALHATVVGLSVLNLGRQNDHSAADLQRGLETLLAAWPRPGTSGGETQ